MKKNKKIITGLIVGSSGIGKAHIREFLNYGMSSVGLLGKVFRKNRVKNLKFDKSLSSKIYNLKNFNDVRKFKPDIISICSPTFLHFNHISKFSKISKKILVEKPLIWKKNSNNFLLSKKVLKKNKKLIVNLPMISLANQILKKEKIKKLKSIYFSYKTKGKNTYSNIPVDLLPHAISFSLQLINFEKLKYKIIKVNKKKTEWSCKINLNGCICNYYFYQNKKRKKSDLFFKLNKNTYMRKQLKIRNNYINKIIKNKKKIININNPMTEYISKSLNSFDNKRFIMLNKRLVIFSTKIVQDLVNYKKK